VFLPYTNTGTISAITANSYYPDCFILNQFRARLKPMSAFGRGVQMAYTEGFTACFKYCNGDTVGIADWNNEPLPILYPNPTANSKITLSGLTRDASISIYNALGQQLLYTETNAPETELDFSQFPEGMYTVRLLSAGQKVRIYKVIHTP
jgi:hypothetical protein